MNTLQESKVPCEMSFGPTNGPMSQWFPAIIHLFEHEYPAGFQNAPVRFWHGVVVAGCRHQDSDQIRKQVGPVLLRVFLRAQKEDCDHGNVPMSEAFLIEAIYESGTSPNALHTRLSVVGVGPLFTHPPDAPSTRELTDLDDLPDDAEDGGDFEPPSDYFEPPTDFEPGGNP